MNLEACFVHDSKCWRCFLATGFGSPSQWWYMGFPGPRNTRPTSLPSYPCSAKWARKLGKMSALHRCPDVLLTSWLIEGLDYVRLPFLTCYNLYLIGINMIMNGIKTEPPIFPKRTALLLSCQESGCIQQTFGFIHQKINGHHPKIGPLGDSYQ